MKGGSSLALRYGKAGPDDQFVCKMFYLSSHEQYVRLFKEN